MPKDFSLDERLAACTDSYEAAPEVWAGRWNRWAPTGKQPRERAFREVRLDLGCGKGAYAIACARREPDVLFVGFDVEGVCAMRGAEAAIAAGVSNVVFCYGDDPDLRTMFGPGELACILMNFPTPFPRKKKAPLRVTYADRLMVYRDLLAPGGFIRLRTDSAPLRDFSLTQFELAGYEVLWTSDNVRASFPDEPESEYERKLVAAGATVVGCAAAPGPAPERVEQTAELSLMHYLPDDLEDVEYVPYGMEGAVENWRNHRRHLRQQGRGDAPWPAEWRQS